MIHSKRILTWALFAAVGIFGSGCGLFHEKELPGRVATTGTNGPDSADCDVVPNRWDMKAAGPIITASLDCMQRLADKTFDSVHGKTADEITVAEIQTLQDNGILNTGFHDSDQWHALEGVASLFNPDGRPVVQRARINQLIQVFRQLGELYSRNAQPLLDNPSQVSDDERLKFVAAIDSLATFFDGKGRISSEQAQELVAYLTKKNTDSAAAHHESPPQFPWKVGHEREWTAAAFTIKDILFTNVTGRTELESAGIGDLLRLGARVAAQLKLTADWMKVSGNPRSFPGPGMRDEWVNSAALVKDYLTKNSFLTISTDQFRWAISTFMPDSGIADSANDLVRLTQRLTPAELRKDGMHAVGLAPFFEVAGQIFDDVQDSLPGFAQCPTEDERNSILSRIRQVVNGPSAEAYPTCKITLRDALTQSPTLRHVALKGTFGSDVYAYAQASGALPAGSKRLDQSFNWTDLMARVFQRRVIGRVFSAFDRDGNGQIKIPENPSDDDREILDLSFALLRFMSATPQGRDPADPHGADGQLEARTANHVPIKPAALAGLVGLIGDNWSIDGNNDGQLNADEFFTIVSTYMSIQKVADQASSLVKGAAWNPATSGMAWPGSPGPEWRYNPDPITLDMINQWTMDWVYRRSKVVTAVSNIAYASALPFLQQDMASIPDDQRLSLFHALIGNPSEPATLYRTNAQIDWSSTNSTTVGVISDGPVILRKYAKSGDVLAPSALLVLLDRMMIVCDRDEDGQLSWSEMSCAAPLVINAAKGIVTSELVDLDPGVHDGSRILLEFLAQPGFPQKLAKTILINGAVRELKIPNQEIAQALAQVHIGWSEIASLIGMPAASTPAQVQLWVSEAKARYQACDLDHNDQINGDAEQKCLTDALLKQSLNLLNQLAHQEGMPDAVAQSLYQQIVQGDLVRVAFLFATTPEADLDHALAPFPDLRGNVAKVLQVLEETIRRSQPLCQDSDC